MLHIAANVIEYNASGADRQHAEHLARPHSHYTRLGCSCLQRMINIAGKDGI